MSSRRAFRVLCSNRADRSHTGREGSEASIITNTVLGAPYYSYSILGPKTFILVFKAPTVCSSERRRNHEDLQEAETQDLM